MTDVHEIDGAASDETSPPRRRRRTRTAAASGTTTIRQRRLRGADLIESLRESVEQLIKENRTLKRQLAKAMAGGGSSAAPSAERTLRSIQRKVLRAVSSDGAPRRRTARAVTASNGRRRRRTTRPVDSTSE